jgi:hypothetical protein
MAAECAGLAVGRDLGQRIVISVRGAGAPHSSALILLRGRRRHTPALTLPLASLECCPGPGRPLFHGFATSLRIRNLDSWGFPATALTMCLHGRQLNTRTTDTFKLSYCFYQRKGHSNCSRRAAPLLAFGLFGFHSCPKVAPALALLASRFAVARNAPRALQTAKASAFAPRKRNPT